MTTLADRAEQVFEEYGVEDDYRWWHPTDRHNYVAILAAVIDGEANAGGTFPTRRDAKEYLSWGWDNSNPREPALLMDLRTGQKFTITVVHTIKLTKEA